METLSDDAWPNEKKQKRENIKIFSAFLREAKAKHRVASNDRGFSSHFISWNLFYWCTPKSELKKEAEKWRKKSQCTFPLWRNFLFPLFSHRETANKKIKLRKVLVLLLILIYKSSSSHVKHAFVSPWTKQPIEMVHDECCPSLRNPFFIKIPFFTPQLNAREAHIFLMAHHHSAPQQVPNKIFN